MKSASLIPIAILALVQLALINAGGGSGSGSGNSRGSGGGSGSGSGGASSGQIPNSVQGVATYYTFYNTSPGSCGAIMPSGSKLVAIPMAYMQNKQYCGYCTTVTYNGKTIKVNVTDTCADCDPTHIDLSDAAFSDLADKSVGKIPVTWSVAPGPCT